MLDSTARAERIELTSSEAASYTWEVAQKPVAVRLPMALIDRLEHEAVENFRSLSSRGSEIGGLLLGSTAPGNPALITLADFELIACDYTRGPLYRLSESDMARYAQSIEKYTGGSGPRVVGYFRSHTRKGLALDAEDISFFEPRFLDPSNIVLLIRPFATKASTAGIFIRENGKIGESSYLEFPFRSSELAGKPGTEKAEPPTPAGPATNVSAAQQPTPKSQSRAQIVPIAPRRETILPEPVVSAPSSAPIAAEPVEPPAPAPSKASAVAPALEVEKPAPAPVAAPPEPKPAREEKSTPIPAMFEAAEPAPKNKKLGLIVAAAAAMVLLVGGGLFVYPAMRNRLSPKPAAVQQDSSPLSLRVERTSGGMLLTWNRDLPVIQGATKVVLAITDGDRHENIQLDPNQVRTGSILYPPMTGDVSFQMEVTDPHQAKTTSESLRVLDPRPSPLADPNAGTSATAKDTKSTAPAPGSTPTDTSSAEASKPTEETPSARAALKTFNTESLAQRLRPAPATAAELPDAPSVTRSVGQNSGNLAGIVTSQPAMPAPPKPTAPAVTSTTTPAAVSPSAESGGQLRPAVVVSRVDPEYPRLARQAGAGGVVELEAIIGADGKVKNPRVVKGNAMLQKAAIDAVMQWRYKPAMLNGKAVESPVEIKLNFVAAR